MRVAIDRFLKKNQSKNLNIFPNHYFIFNIKIKEDRKLFFINNLFWKGGEGASKRVLISDEKKTIIFSIGLQGVKARYFFLSL